MVLYFGLIFHEENTEPTSKQPLTQGQPGKFWENVANITKVIFDKKFRIILVSAWCLVAVPGFGAIYNYYYVFVLHFTPITMGHIHFIGILAYIVAILMINSFFHGVRFKRYFLVTNFVLILMYSTNLVLLFRLNIRLGISDQLFCFSSTALMNFVAELVWIPILALGSRLSPKGLEGTTYSIFTAVFNMASYASALGGTVFAYIYGVNKTRFDNLWKLTMIQICLLWLFLVVLTFVKFPKIAKKKVPSEKNTELFSLTNRDMDLPQREESHVKSMDLSTKPTDIRKRKKDHFPKRNGSFSTSAIN